MRRALALVLVMALAAGCASVGPATIARDRVDYDQAITASWKRSMLLNMVKLRYADTPMFLDVASIINSYTLEGQVNAGIDWPGVPRPATRAASRTSPTSPPSRTTRCSGSASRAAS